MFNPYLTQPLMQSFFMGRPMPDEVAAAAKANPDGARHVVSVWQFMTWLNQSFPQLYNSLSPAETNPIAVIESGAISPSPARFGAKLRGLRGLGQDESGATKSSGDIFSEWGNRVSDFAGKLLVYDQQRKLIDLNIKRAEQGLPPIDASNYGASVNVGLSPQAQQLAYLAVGGLVIAGLVGALRRK